MNSNYLEFLLSLGFFNIKLGLSTITEMLQRLDNPHLDQKVIHIAGTNGKGSTLITLEGLLLESGFTTGSTISPHLIHFNERFRINGHPVTDEELDQAFEEVCFACDIDLSLDKAGSRDGSISPTFFEFSIAIAFVLFRKFKVDYVLLETGMGGRLDATNVVPNPLACVITRIAMDHQEYLGASIEEIAAEKLGIVKKGSEIFVAFQDKRVKDKILQCFRHQGLQSNFSPEEFGYKSSGDKSMVFYMKKTNGSTETRFQIETSDLALLGEHQKENTATALAVYWSIVPFDRFIDHSEINKVLASITWEGRMQYLGQDKRILIDGAHNNSGFCRLLQHLNQNHAGIRILFAIGWKQNKTIFEGISHQQLARFDFLPLQMTMDHAESPDGILKTLDEKDLNPLQPLTINQFSDKIEHNGFDQYDLIVISGSLYLVGEFLGIWKSRH